MKAPKVMNKVWTMILLALTLVGCTKNDWLDWKTQNELWLINNIAQDPEVKQTSSGLQYKIIADPNPTDARPNSNSSVVCDYTVRLINGYQVDGGISTLSLSNTIAGFTEGLRLIHTNGDIELYIPCYLGYDQAKYDDDTPEEAEGTGTEGTSSYIPPYSTLIYRIHLCSVSSGN